MMTLPPLAQEDVGEWIGIIIFIGIAAASAIGEALKKRRQQQQDALRTGREDMPAPKGMSSGEFGQARRQGQGMIDRVRRAMAELEQNAAQAQAPRRPEPAATPPPLAPQPTAARRAQADIRSSEGQDQARRAIAGMDQEMLSLRRQFDTLSKRRARLAGKLGQFAPEAPPAAGAGLRRDMNLRTGDPQKLREAMIYREILGPPRALKPELECW